MAARLKQLLRLTPTLSPSFLGRNSKISSHVLCGCTQADTFITRNQSKADSRFFITHAVADDSIELGPSATHLMRSSLLHQRRCSFTISKRNDHRISRAFTSGSCDQKTGKKASWSFLLIVILLTVDRKHGATLAVCNI